MELCPDCNKRLLKERDEYATIKTTEGQKSRLLRTYFDFTCGSVWIKNEDYPEGINDTSCKKK